MSRHGAVEIRLSGKTSSYRLGLSEIEELEERLEMSIFLIGGALAAELPFLRAAQWKHIIRLGLIGGGEVNRSEADDVTEAMIEEHGAPICTAIALQIVGAALGKVFTTEEDAPGEADTPNSSGSTSEKSTEPQP